HRVALGIEDQRQLRSAERARFRGDHRISELAARPANVRVPGGRSAGRHPAQTIDVSDSAPGALWRPTRGAGSVAEPARGRKAESVRTGNSAECRRAEYHQ